MKSSNPVGVVARIASGTLALLLITMVTAQSAVATAQGTTLTFDEAVARAAEAPSVLSAVSQLEIARLDLDTAQAPLQGNLNAAADTSWGAGSDLSASISASANLNVVPFGPRAEAAQRATNAVTRAENDLLTARWAASVQVVRQYAAANATSRGSTAADAALSLAEDRLSATHERLAAGAANEADVLQAEIALSQAANARALALVEHRAALTELSITLGVPVSAVADDVPEAAGLDLLLSAEPAERTRLRADVIAAELAVVEATTSLAAAKRDTYPSASVDLSYRASSDGTSLQLGAGFDTTSFQPNVSAGISTSSGAGAGGGAGASSVLGIGVGVSVPFGGGGANAVAAAEIRLATATTQRDRTLLAAQAEVQALLRSLTGAEAQSELAERLLAQAEASFEAARTRYQLGLVSILDLDESELALQDALDAAQNARDAQLLTAMDLAVALSIDPKEVLR